VRVAKFHGDWEVFRSDCVEILAAEFRRRVIEMETTDGTNKNSQRDEAVVEFTIELTESSRIT